MKECQGNSASLWEEMIQLMDAKIVELKSARRTFQRMRDLGEPWPGKDRIGQSLETSNPMAIPNKRQHSD
jgi:hypothetical protein